MFIIEEQLIFDYLPDRQAFLYRCLLDKDYILINRGIDRIRDEKDVLKRNILYGRYVERLDTLLHYDLIPCSVYKGFRDNLDEAFFKRK